MTKFGYSFLLFFLMGMINAQTPCLSPSISGKLTYDNFQNTKLAASKVYLKTLSGLTIDSSMTDQNGNFRFCAVPTGGYKLQAKTNIPYGGINASDALIAFHHFMHLDTLTGIRFKAGDVFGVSYINCGDALLILEHFDQLITSFPVGDWVFDEPQITISDTMSHLVNIKGLCTGDLDGSYIPFIQSFNTCGDTMADQRDMQKYPTVQIGSQCWMKTNLNIGTMVTSTSTSNYHSDCSNNGIIEKYCSNNSVINCTIYGGLYDWNEMMQYDTTAGIQGICPIGWHIPTDAEWCVLATTTDPSVNCSVINYTGTDAGAKLKEVGTAHWLTPNTGATNQYGFTGLGASNRSATGQWPTSMRVGAFWTSSVAVNLTGINWNLNYNKSNIYRGNQTRVLGFSVRCLKN